MINRLKRDRKRGWSIEYSTCDEQVTNWPVIYYKDTPKEFMRHVKQLERQLHRDRKLLLRLADHFERDLDEKAKYFPCCPECHKVLDEKMTCNERIQHIIDCLKKAGKWQPKKWRPKK